MSIEAVSTTVSEHQLPARCRSAVTTPLKALVDWWFHGSGMITARKRNCGTLMKWSKILYSLIVGELNALTTKADADVQCIQQGGLILK